MNKIIKKTLGGLNFSYYFRHFIFGVLMAAGLIFISSQNALRVDFIVFCAISALLYPYSRFVYESIVGFIMGENIFFANAIIVLITKLITMLICFGFALFIAPVGLCYLYYYHTKNHTFDE